MSTLYNTTNPEEGIEYLKEDFNQEQSVNPPPPKVPNGYISPIEQEFVKRNPFGVIAANPKRSPIVMPSESEFVRLGEEVNRYDEGFQGTSYEALKKHREDTQSQWNKGFNTIVGGVLSGVGTFIEDVGYLSDMNTYIGLFRDVDYESNKNLGLFQYTQSQLVSQGLQTFGKGIKAWTEDYMPVYENIGSGIADNVFSWGSLKSVLDSAVGFGLTGFGAGTVAKVGLKTLAKGLAKSGRFIEAVANINKFKSLSKVARTIENYNWKVSRLDTYVDMLAKSNSKLLNNLETFGASVMTKGAESRMEGLESYETTLANLQYLKQSGKLSDQEIHDLANKEANYAARMTWATIGLDYIALKGLLKPKINIDKIIKPGFKSSMLNTSKVIAEGIFREGPEEMWQETAKQEGMYNVYEAIKERLSNDEELQLINKMGFDPDDLPKGFVGRTLAMMASDQSQIAGWIGAISGPLQNLALSLPGRKARKEEQQKQYDKQQSLMQQNEVLFKNMVGFTDAVKKKALSDDLKGFAETLADPFVMNIAKQLEFKTIVMDNIRNGTLDHLEGTLLRENTEEARELLKELDTLKKEYITAKKYITAEDVLNLQQDIRMQKQLSDYFSALSENSDISVEEQKQYKEAAEVAKSASNAMQATLSELIKPKTQAAIYERIKKQEELDNLYAELPNMNSITLLERLAKKYDNDKTILDRVSQIKKERKEEAIVEKLQSNTISETTESEVTNPVSNPSVRDNSKLKLEEGNDYIYENSGKQSKVTYIKTTQNAEGIQTVHFKRNGKNVSIQNSNKDPNFVDKYFRSIEETVSNTNQAQDSFEEDVNGFLTELNTVAKHDATNAITFDKEDYKVIKEKAKQIEKDPEADAIMSEFIVNKFNEKVKAKKSQPKPEVEEIEHIVIDETEKDLLSQLGNAVAEEVLKDEGTIGKEDEIILEDFEASKPKYSLQEIFHAYYNHRTIVKGKEYKNFREFMEELIASKEIPLAVIKEGFRKFKYLYGYYTDQDVDNDPSTFEEMFDTKNAGEISSEDENFMENKQLVEDLQHKVDPSTSLPRQLGILEPTTKAIDNKNDSPGNSVAYRSQRWVWKFRKFEKGEKVVQKENKESEIEPSPIINPNRFNVGDELEFTLNTEYDGSVNVNGVPITWQTVLEASKLPSKWQEFKNENNLGNEVTIYDYWPILIKGPNAEDLSASVHNVDWINSKNAVGSEEELADGRIKHRAFKTQLINYFLNNPGSIVKLKIVEKPIKATNSTGKKSIIDANGNEVVKEFSISRPSGFALIKSDDEFKPIIQQLPASDAKVVVNIGGEFSGSIKMAQVLNAFEIKDKLKATKGGSTYTLVPVGKVNGSMKYWAYFTPVRKLKNTPEGNKIIKSLRTALEIFVTQNENTNKEFYESLKLKKEQIDLKKYEDLLKFFRKIIVAFSGELEGQYASADSPRVSFSKGIIQFSLQKGKVISFKANEVTDFTQANLDVFEEQVLPELWFNVSTGKMVELGKDFSFSYIDADGTIQEFEGDYQMFSKSHLMTDAGSVKLRDGSYAYTKQQVIRFDTNIKFPITYIADEATNKEIQRQLSALVPGDKIMYKDKEYTVGKLIPNIPLSFVDDLGLPVSMKSIFGVKSDVKQQIPVVENKEVETVTTEIQEQIKLWKNNKLIQNTAEDLNVTIDTLIQVALKKENPIQYIQNLVNLRNSARTLNANDNLKCKK